MYRWRYSTYIARVDMVRIMWAVRELLRELSDDPNVQIEELFGLDPQNPDNWQV
jgi:hypothetical protein